MNKDYEKSNYKYEEAIRESEKRNNIQRKFEIILKLYMLIGIITAVFGIAYFVLSTLNIELSRSQINALLIAGVGFAITMLSWAMLLVKRERRLFEQQHEKSMESVSEFLRYWAKFENISKDVLEKEHRQFNKYSIREIIELLYEEGKIDKSDILALEEAIQLRNAVVHKGDSLPSEKAKKYIELLTNVIQKVVP